MRNRRVEKQAPKPVNIHVNPERSVVVDTKFHSVSAREMHCIEFKVSGSHAIIQAFLDNKKLLESENKKNLRNYIPTGYISYFGKAKFFIITSLMLYHMFMHEKNAWKVIVMLTTIIFCYGRMAQEPIKLERARQIDKELKQVQQDIYDMRNTTEIRHDGRTERVKMLPNDIQVTRTHSKSNWLDTPRTSQELRQHEEAIMISQAELFIKQSEEMERPTLNK